MTKLIKKVSENESVQEVEIGFNANADQLAKLFYSGNLSATVGLLKKSLFESIVFNLAEVEKRIKNANDKEYSKIFYVYNNLINQCRNFVLDTENARRIEEERQIDEIAKKVTATILKRMKALLGTVIDEKNDLEFELNDLVDKSDDAIDALLAQSAETIENHFKEAFKKLRSAVNRDLNFYLNKNGSYRNLLEVINRIEV